MAEGGSQEFVQNGYAVGGEFYFSFRQFQVLSNELSRPTLLICPDRHPAARNEFWRAPEQQCQLLRRRESQVREAGFHPGRRPESHGQFSAESQHPAHGSRQPVVVDVGNAPVQGQRFVRRRAGGGMEQCGTGIPAPGVNRREPIYSCLPSFPPPMPSLPLLPVPTVTGIIPAPIPARRRHRPPHQPQHPSTQLSRHCRADSAEKTSGQPGTTGVPDVVTNATTRPHRCHQRAGQRQPITSEASDSATMTFDQRVVKSTAQDHHRVSICWFC